MAVCTQGYPKPISGTHQEGISTAAMLLFPGRSLSSQARSGTNGGTGVGKAQGPALLPLHEPVSSSLPSQSNLNKTLSRSVNTIA